MNAADFELNVSMPADSRFADTMRELAAHAARYAGCDAADADRYAAAVHTVVLACVDRAASGAMLPVILRRGTGPIEFLIGCEGRFDAARHDRQVTVGWTREQGTSMCRVAFEPRT
jgi:hypothetical protein